MGKPAKNKQQPLPASKVPTPGENAGPAPGSPCSVGSSSAERMRKHVRAAATTAENVASAATVSIPKSAPASVEKDQATAAPSSHSSESSDSEVDTAWHKALSTSLNEADELMGEIDELMGSGPVTTDDYS